MSRSILKKRLKPGLSSGADCLAKSRAISSAVTRLTAVLAGLVVGLSLSGPAGAQGTAGRVADDVIPETETACTEAGGRWDRGGLAGQFLCFLPTPDAGKACTTAGDCSGFCLVETGSCSAESPLFGCFAIFELDGAEVTLCID